MRSRSHSYSSSPTASLTPAQQKSSINAQQDIPFPSFNGIPGSLNDDAIVRGVVTESIKRSSKSREQIAEEMSRALSLSVTARMITAFTSESKEMHRWPAAWDRAFCAAVGDDTLLTVRIELAGMHVIDQEDTDVLELGRQYLIRKRADEEIALLEARLRGRAVL